MSTPRRVLLIALALIGLLACSKSPELARLPAGAPILAFGDSLTFGTGATPETSYPVILAGLIGHPVINAGVPGDTTADGVERFREALDEAEPRLVILCLGGNDFLRRLPETETVANLRALLDEAKARKLPVLLVATPKPGLGLSIPRFYAELAEAYGLPLESAALADILSDQALKSDPIHPNALGYRQLVLALAAQLRESGAVQTP